MIAHLDPLVLTRLLALIDGASLRLLIAIAAAGGELKAPKAMATAAKISASECAAAIATIGTIKAIGVTGSGANARVRIIYPGLLVLHPSTAETRVARGGTPRAAAEADGGRRSLVALRDERVVRLSACGGEELVTATDALIAGLIERAGGRWPLADQLRIYEAAITACAERGAPIALEAVQATAAARIDPAKGPERYLAAVARRLETGGGGSGLASRRAAPKIPRPKPVLGSDDF